MTGLINNTVNHHFISQAELRQNSLNFTKKAAESKIFRYQISDKNKLKLSKPSKPEIRNTSCKSDLFTLDFLDSGSRLNLEKYFKYFEDKYTAEADKFLGDLKVKVDEAVGRTDRIDGSEFENSIKFLRKIKFMNYIRNPFMIRKSLKEFSFCRDFIVHGVGEEFNLILRAITENNEKNKRQRDYLCRLYDVTPTEYLSWIKLLILFLYFDEKNKVSLIDGMIEEYFIAKELHTTVLISYYSDESLLRPLVPDTGCIMHYNMGCLFNVSKNCFVALEHKQIDSDEMREVAVETLRQMELPLNEGNLQLVKKCVAGNKTFKIIVNDKELLEAFNRECIKESVEFVFSSSNYVPGAEILE